MSNSNFRNLDLNLLRVFEALLAEGSATQAGARLGLSQSAISHALARLRQSMGDELFVRGPTGLQPTPRALELAPAIQKAMKLLETAVLSPRFDPATTERQFVICATAYISAVLMPAVVRRFMAEAPRAHLLIRGQDVPFADDLSRGRIDGVVGGFEQVPGEFAYTPLFVETGVWVVRSGHPALAGGEPGLERLAGLSQVVVGPKDVVEARRALRPNLGLKRLSTWSDDYSAHPPLNAFKVALTVPDSFSALAIVSRTDLVALLPRRLAETAASRAALVLIEPPVHPSPANLGVVTRASEIDSGPISWLVGLLQAASKEI